MDNPQTTPSAMINTVPKRTSRSGSNFPPTMEAASPMIAPSAGPISPSAKDGSTPTHQARSGPDLPPSNRGAVANDQAAAGPLPGSDQLSCDTQDAPVAAADSPSANAGAPPSLAPRSGPDLPPTTLVASPSGHPSAGPDSPSATRATTSMPGARSGPDTPPTNEQPATTTTASAGPYLDPLLIMAAATVDDLEGVRMAAKNRLAAMQREYGLGDLAPQVVEARRLADGLKALEDEAVLSLKRAMRRHPLNAWVRNRPGVGEKQAARLLAVVGDPLWNTAEDRRRTVAELRSYCGWGDAQAQRRRRGQRANWSDEARKRTWLIAESCMKNKDSAFRKVYDEARAKYADAVHDEPCVRCGPSGKPALPGSPLSLGHQHARGLRAVSKAILRDLWRMADALAYTPTT